MHSASFSSGTLKNGLGRGHCWMLTCLSRALPFEGLLGATALSLGLSLEEVVVPNSSIPSFYTSGVGTLEGPKLSHPGLSAALPVACEGTKAAEAGREGGLRQGCTQPEEDAWATAFAKRRVATSCGSSSSPAWFWALRGRVAWQGAWIQPQHSCSSQ